MRWIKLGIELFFAFGLLINAALFVPQGIKLFRLKKSGSLSLLTYLGFNAVQLILFLHGYYHHDITLMIGMFISFITCGIVTAGIFLYRKRQD